MLTLTLHTPNCHCFCLWFLLKCFYLAAVLVPVPCWHWLTALMSHWMSAPGVPGVSVTHWLMSGKRRTRELSSWMCSKVGRVHSAHSRLKSNFDVPVKMRCYLIPHPTSNNRLLDNLLHSKFIRLPQTELLIARWPNFLDPKAWSDIREAGYLMSQSWAAVGKKIWLPATHYPIIQKMGCNTLPSSLPCIVCKGREHGHVASVKC